MRPRGRYCMSTARVAGLKLDALGTVPPTLGTRGCLPFFQRRVLPPKKTPYFTDESFHSFLHFLRRGENFNCSHPGSHTKAAYAFFACEGCNVCKFKIWPATSGRHRFSKINPCVAHNPQSSLKADRYLGRDFC